jgi:putative transcriptional regulator
MTDFWPTDEPSCVRYDCQLILNFEKFEEKPNKIVQNRLKELRLLKEMTQQSLADAVLVSRQTVNSIETGKYDPSLPLAFKISRLLSVKIEDIFTPDI